MPDETCNATTSSGDPCSNPARDDGYCHIDSHASEEDDETCGAETASGDPCQHPAGENGYCHIPAHNPDGGGTDQGGRPSKFTDQLWEEIIYFVELAIEENSIPTKALIARCVGIHPETLGRWLQRGEEDFKEDEDTDFSEFYRDFTRARTADETKRLQQLADRNPEWVMTQVYGYDPSTQRHEVAGPGGGPVEVDTLPDPQDVFQDEEMEEAAMKLAERQIEDDRPEEGESA